MTNDDLKKEAKQQEYAQEAIGNHITIPQMAVAGLVGGCQTPDADMYGRFLEKQRLELRDKFAMAALTGIISSMTYEEWLDTEYDIVAENSFEMANAMMDAREKK